MNNTPLTPKQEELKKRLEQIRRQRNEEARAEQNAEKPVPKKMETRPRRNEKMPQQQRQKQKPVPTPLTRSESDTELKQPEIRKELRESTHKSKQVVTQVPKLKNKNSLVKQLSSGDRLVDTIILSEVLSKPIALRKK